MKKQLNVVAVTMSTLLFGMSAYAAGINDAPIGGYATPQNACQEKVVNSFARAFSQKYRIPLSKITVGAIEEYCISPEPCQVKAVVSNTSGSHGDIDFVNVSGDGEDASCGYSNSDIGTLGSDT